MNLKDVLNVAEKIEDLTLIGFSNASNKLHSCEGREYN